MAKFTVEINCDDDACVNNRECDRDGNSVLNAGPEVARILSELAGRLERGGLSKYDIDYYETVCMDRNGNKVGSAKFTS